AERPARPPETTQPKPPPASLQRESRDQQAPSTSKHSETDSQASAERDNQSTRKMAPAANSERAINSDISGTADKKLTQCVMPEAQWGRYSSLDGGKSAGDILNSKCASEWLQWV